MGCARIVMRTSFELLRYAVNTLPSSGIGAMPAVNNNNIVRVGSVFKGRVTPGDSLEPDVLGTTKKVGQDLTSMWIGFFDFPLGDIKIESGDYVRDIDDTTRVFQVQFIDRYPGGKGRHHYETRLLTTEVFRNMDV